MQASPANTFPMTASMYDLTGTNAEGASIVPVENDRKVVAPGPQNGKLAGAW